MLEESRTAVVVNATSSFHASGALVVSNQRPQSPKLLQQDHQTARAGMRAASCCPPAAWMLLLVLATAAASAALPVASDTPSPATQRATGNEPAVSTAAGATAGTGGRRSLSAAFTRPTRRRPTRRGRPTRRRPTRRKPAKRRPTKSPRRFTRRPTRRPTLRRRRTHRPSRKRPTAAKQRPTPKSPAGYAAKARTISRCGTSRPHAATVQAARLTAQAHQSNTRAAGVIVNINVY